MLEEIKAKIEGLVSELSARAAEIRQGLETAQAAATPAAEKEIVAALIAALEAQGYTVTPPAAPAAPAEPASPNA